MRRLIMLAVLSLLSVAVCVAEEVVKIRSDMWMPFNGDPKSNYPGYVIELAQVIFGKAGIKVDYEVMPWTKSLQEVRKGTYDAVVGAKLKETPDFVVASEPVGVVQDSLYALRECGWVFAPDNLRKEVRLGVVSDYLYSDMEINEYLKQSARAVRKVESCGEEPALDNVSKLVKGEVDVVVETPPVFAWYVKKLGLKDSDFQSVVVGRAERCYIAFSPARESSKRYAKIFSDGLKAMRASGELKAILDKYNVKSW